MPKQYSTLNQTIYTSKEKSWVRRVIAEMSRRIDCRHIVTLAGPYGVDAKMFAYISRGIRVTSIEKDLETWKCQQEELKYIPSITPLFCTLEHYLEHIAKTSLPIDCAYFDFMGVYTARNTEKCIELYFANANLPRNSLFFLTVAKGREKVDEFLEGSRLLKSCCNDPEDYMADRKKAISAIVPIIARDHGYGLKRVMYKSYKNSAHGITMMVFGFEAVKK